MWCPVSDSNRPPTDYKSVALPDELTGRNFTYSDTASTGSETGITNPGRLAKISMR